MKIFAKPFMLLSLVLALASCATVKDIQYFRDSQDQSEVALPAVRTVTVEVADQLSIVVSSKDPELAAMFNLPMVSHSATAGASNGFGGTQNQISVYTVDSKGNIDFPLLGAIHVGGLTREEVVALIKNEIVSQNFIKDAVVTVEFANFYVSVLGEVARPGRIQLDKDKMTIIDAIAKAGDLTINGQRSNIKLYREENGKQHCYVINFNSADNVFSSPVYYLRQDDVIYVEPNKMRARQSTVNGNNLLSVPFWVSAGSFLVSVTTMILTTQNAKAGK